MTKELLLLNDKLDQLQRLEICHKIVNLEQQKCLDEYDNSENSYSGATLMTELGSPLTLDSTVIRSSQPQESELIVDQQLSIKNSACKNDSVINQSQKNNIIQNISNKITKYLVEKSNDGKIVFVSSVVNIKLNNFFDFSENSIGPYKMKLSVDHTIMFPNKEKYSMQSSKIFSPDLFKTKLDTFLNKNKSTKDNLTLKLNCSFRSAINEHCHTDDNCLIKNNKKTNYSTLKVTSDGFSANKIRYPKLKKQSSGTKKNRNMDRKLVKKRQKKLIRHCQPLRTARKFGYSDKSTVMDIQTLLSLSKQNNQHNFIDYSRRAIKFQPEVIAKRVLDENKKQELLVCWFPSGILDDEWITCNKNTNLSEIERIVPIMSMNAENRDSIMKLYFGKL